LTESYVRESFVTVKGWIFVVAMRFIANVTIHSEELHVVGSAEEICSVSTSFVYKPRATASAPNIAKRIANHENYAST
jgi:hypothetical protein